MCSTRTHSDEIQSYVEISKVLQGYLGSLNICTIKGQVLGHLKDLGGTMVNQNTYIPQNLVRCLAAMLGRT
jgi:hypothetical protein